MPAKKAKPNGFSCFMMDMRKKFEAEGRRYNNLGELVPICSPMWTTMSPEEKAVYNQRAKNTEVKQERCDTRGVPISLREREEQNKQLKKMKSQQEIEEMISNLSEQGAIIEELFHFGHFNYAVETDEKQYPPCEVAITKFSLVSGIKDHYHQFINPGTLPTGYSYEAKVHSEQTHMIPLYDFKEFSSNYVNITNAIKEILATPEGGIAPLFVLDDDIPKVEYMLQWLINKSIESDKTFAQQNGFKVMSINKLFYELRRHADLSNPRLKFTSTAQVAEKLMKGTFYHCSNMACQWHEEQDRTKYCSLTQVRSYAYEISDFCCEHYDLRLLPNRHAPGDIADETRYEVQPKMAKRENDPWDSKSIVSNASSVRDDLSEEPRKPFSAVGPRLAANFPSPGLGRGLLGASFGSPSSPIPGSPSSAASTPAPVGRGRGRGLLAMMDDD